MNKKIVWALLGASMLASVVGISYRFTQLKYKTAERAQAANLVVYTHSSFMDAYGPGADLKAEFEKSCVCTVQYVDAGGTSELIEKLKLDPERRVDVILGLDFLQLKRVATSLRLQKLPVSDVPLVPEVSPYKFAQFRPYDWSPMGIIYREGELPVATSWQQVLQQWPKAAITLPDPTLSTPGFMWLYDFVGNATPAEAAQLLSQWRSLVHSYSPSWSSAYGLFKNKQSQATYSYLTSLVYHWQVENDRSYRFMQFEQGQPLQIEYAAVPDTCWNCNEAKRFVEFLLSDFAQSKIAEKNFMLPVRQGVVLPALFQELPKVKIRSAEGVESFVDQREMWLETWRAQR